MSLNFAANLNKMITAGLGGAVDAPASHVAVGYHVERKTVSGNPISITDGAKNQPVESCVVSFSPIQDLSNGDPSPDNICPISGRTGVTVTGCGVNQWDEEWEVGGINSSTGATESVSDRIRSKNFISVSPETTYYAYSEGMSGNDFRMFFYDAEQNFISVGAWQYSGTFTTPANCRYAKFIRYGATTYNNDISINYPSSDTSYHAYTGTTHTISLPSTVYGGTDEIISGQGTVTYVFYQFDDTTNYHCSGAARMTSGWAISIVDIDGVSGLLKANGHVLSSASPADASYATATVTGFCKALGGGQIIIYITDSDSGLDSTASGSDITTAVNTWVHANTPQICYELATPTPITTDPVTDMVTLDGDNTIFTDADSLTVTYRDIVYTEGY